MCFNFLFAKAATVCIPVSSCDWFALGKLFHIARVFLPKRVIVLSFGVAQVAAHGRFASVPSLLDGPGAIHPHRQPAAQAVMHRRQRWREALARRSPRPCVCVCVCTRMCVSAHVAPRARVCVRACGVLALVLPIGWPPGVLL